jgi:hypothetical protein
MGKKWSNAPRQFYGRVDSLRVETFLYVAQSTQETRTLAYIQRVPEICTLISTGNRTRQSQRQRHVQVLFVKPFSCSYFLFFATTCCVIITLSGGS